MRVNELANQERVAQRQRELAKCGGAQREHCTLTSVLRFYFPSLATCPDRVAARGVGATTIGVHVYFYDKFFIAGYRYYRERMQFGVE